MDDEIRIISVKAKKKGQNCIIVFEDGNSLQCSYDLILKYKLGNNIVISSEVLNEIKREQRLSDAKQTAYNFVSYKPRTERQIRQKLRDKGYDKEEGDTAIEFLIKFDLVDDDRYAMLFISDYLKRKSSGKSKLLTELLRKGIDKSLAEDAIEKYYPEVDTFDLAVKSANKKLRVIRHKPKEKQKQSLIRYLQTSGFDWDVIRKVLKEIHFGDIE